ncbi:MAG: ester cyclase [Anaerolineales bacterium]
MSTETNKATVRRMLEQVWNKRRVDLIEEFYTEDVVQHIVGISSTPGLESVRKAAGMILNAYPDLQHAINDEIAEGDKVVNRWTMTSTHPGGLNGVPPAGKGVIQSGVTIFHLSNARIDEFWSLTDNSKLMQQLGVIPPGAA